MAELENDPPQTSKCLTLSAIVLFLAFVASSVPTLLSSQPRTNTSVVKASSGVVQPSFIATNLPGPQQQFHQQQQQQQQVLPGAIVYTSPATIPPSQATADPLSPDQSPSTQNTPDQNDQQQRREHLIEKTTILELFLIAVKVSFKVAFWFLSLIYRSIRYAVVQPAGILMRLLETPLGMMREIYKTVMPVYSFFTVAAIIGVVVGAGDQCTWRGPGQDTTTISTPYTGRGTAQAAHHLIFLVLFARVTSVVAETSSYRTRTRKGASVDSSLYHQQSGSESFVRNSVPWARTGPGTEEERETRSAAE
ncbi:hypothetical protein CPB97_001495 [Podila verticillata]|nr:hypothetical protein CPB97_001495 [Podila verticillata]